MTTETKKSIIIKEKSSDFSSLTNFSQNINKKFIITKKIAKHGNQSIIVIPRALENRLKPGTLAQITIDVMEKFVDEDVNEGVGSGK